jgi:hypothetical protein
MQAPLIADPPGPARNVISAATSAASTNRLADCFGDHAGEDVVPADPAQAHVVADLVVGQRGAHPAGGDGVDGQARPGAFQGGDLHQPEHGVLGRDVGRAPIGATGVSPG